MAAAGVAPASRARRQAGRSAGLVAGSGGVAGLVVSFATSWVLRGGFAIGLVRPRLAVGVGVVDPGAPSSSASSASSASTSLGLVVVLGARRPRSTPRRRGAPPRAAAARPSARPAIPAGGARRGRSSDRTITTIETTIAVGSPKNVQLLTRRVSSAKRTDRVPDEEDQEQVAGPHPAPEPAGDPQQRDGADDAAQRLVQEQRLEAGGRLGVERARVLDDAVGAVDRDAPRQVGRRPVQLLVEEVAEPADRLHHEQAGRDDVRPLRERLVPAAGDVPAPRWCR